ncbi:sulfate transporter [Mycobacterium montefiorense]|uniref:Sulfate transporter n=1 Tax=Mycobacterium montefiorense TaxID=154654 RepID=A0AA37V0X1_9MYCO|nr:sulfate transporter [Mycobacterium montefiorense]GKU64395.1 sulfate transporter [Mycobacterium montefiorense]GKU67850.1 sulfate transporter [Mycobacterium montefiorense]GKU74843.1 sulfate transporter [Mycobacterium montefiorense]
MGESSVGVDTECRRDVVVLTATGVLDSTSYRALRDVVIKAALDEPRAVIVDVDDLFVPSESAWSVFTSARWHVSTWPGVPILLVCGNRLSQRALTANGVSRYVPVHGDRGSALGDALVRSVDGRRRERTRLPARAVSTGLARALIAESLHAWAQNRLIVNAGTVASVFVQNVLDHTDSAPVLIVESCRDTVTVAVEDESFQPAGRLESENGAVTLSGLSIVSALCRAWGSTPMPSGKTVWAQVGRENQL